MQSISEDTFFQGIKNKHQLNICAEDLQLHCKKSNEKKKNLKPEMGTRAVIASMTQSVTYVAPFKF